MNDRLSLLMGVFTAALAAGCGGAEGVDENIGTTGEAVTFTPPAEDVAYPLGYEWKWGMISPRMPLTSTHFCALAGIQGLFRTSGDHVYVTGHSPGIWGFGGGIGTGVPGGFSYCVQTQPGGAGSTQLGRYDTKVYFVDTTIGTVDLGSTSNRTCLLTGVGGKLSGNSSFVRTRISSGGRWLLEAAGASSDAVRGWAMCVNWPASPSAAFYSWTAGASATPLPTWGGRHLFSSSRTGDRACLLTSVQGSFLTRNTNRNNVASSRYTRVGANEFAWWLHGERAEPHHPGHVLPIGVTPKAGGRVGGAIRQGGVLRDA